MKIKDILIITLLTILLIVVVVKKPDSENLGSALHNSINTVFVQGLRAGINQTQVINSSAEVVGAIKSTELAVDTDTLKVDSTNDRVGIGTSTPTTDLSIGTANATSTISMGNFCVLAQDENDREMWITLAISGTDIFATSTSPCND